MAEEIQQATTDQSTELELLRVANADLTKKSKLRKAKVEELEATNTTLQAELRRLTVDVPMRAMAESMSKVPELFIEQFNKSHRLEMIDGKLTIVSTDDGKPINVEFEREALIKHVTDDKHPQANNFKAIVFTSRASGAAGTGNTTVKRRSTQPTVTPRKFGLQ